MAEDAAQKQAKADRYKWATDTVANYKNNESTLDSVALQNYVSALTELNSGDPEFASKTQTARDQFQALVFQRLTSKGLAAHLSEKAAEQAANRFIVNRDTGSKGLVDFVTETGGFGKQAVQEALQDINVNSYLPGNPPQGTADEIKRVSGLFTEKQKAETEKTRVDSQINLAGSQRDQALSFFNQAAAGVGTPIPTFTPELSEAMLQKIQQDISGQGDMALQRTEADKAKRGLTGSSIEAFAKGETEGNIADAFANATLQFLSNSGTAAAQNRQFLVNSLLTQAQSLLGASQQTESLVTGREITGSQLDLQRTQLQSQIDQFNRQFQEGQRQFQSQMDFQKSQSTYNLALLMQQLSQPRSGNATGAIFSGIGTGIGTGAMIGGPVGGLVGAGAGLATGLAAYFGNRK